MRGRGVVEARKGGKEECVTLEIGIVVHFQAFVRSAMQFLER